MKAMVRVITAALTLTLLFGCQSMSEWMQEVEEKRQADYRLHYCHYDGAYSMGVNDARDQRSMNPSVADLCDPDVRSDVLKGYREGYQEALKNMPTQITIQNHTHNHRTEHHVRPETGYHPPAKRECHRAKDGTYVCGYNCIEYQGNWHCGHTPEEHCVREGNKIICHRR